MVKAQQVTGQQTEIVPYQEALTPQEITTQSFLELMSIIPMIMILFFFMLMMGLMRDIAREPGKAKEIVVKAIEVGKEVGKEVVGVVGAVKGTRE